MDKALCSRWYSKPISHRPKTASVEKTDRAYSLSQIVSARQLEKGEKCQLPNLIRLLELREARLDSPSMSFSRPGCLSYERGEPVVNAGITLQVELFRMQLHVLKAYEWWQLRLKRLMLFSDTFIVSTLSSILNQFWQDWFCQNHFGIRACRCRIDSRVEPKLRCPH